MYLKVRLEWSKCTFCFIDILVSLLSDGLRVFEIEQSDCPKRWRKLSHISEWRRSIYFRKDLLNSHLVDKMFKFQTLGIKKLKFQRFHSLEKCVNCIDLKVDSWQSLNACEAIFSTLGCLLTKDIVVKNIIFNWFHLEWWFTDLCKVSLKLCQSMSVPL